MTVKTFEMEIHRGTEPTVSAGWHLVWLRMGMKPVVIYNTAGSTVWRDPVRRVEVEFWTGPIPERDQTRKAA